MPATTINLLVGNVTQDEIKERLKDLTYQQAAAHLSEALLSISRDLTNGADSILTILSYIDDCSEEQREALLAIGQETDTALQICRDFRDSAVEQDRKHQKQTKSAKQKEISAARHEHLLRDIRKNESWESFPESLDASFFLKSKDEVPTSAHFGHKKLKAFRDLADLANFDEAAPELLRLHTESVRNGKIQIATIQKCSQLFAHRSYYPTPSAEAVAVETTFDYIDANSDAGSDSDSGNDSSVSNRSTSGINEATVENSGDENGDNEYNETQPQSKEGDSCNAKSEGIAQGNQKLDLPTTLDRVRAAPNTFDQRTELKEESQRTHIDDGASGIALEESRLQVGSLTPEQRVSFEFRRKRPASFASQTHQDMAQQRKFKRRKTGLYKLDSDDNSERGGENVEVGRRQSQDCEDLPSESGFAAESDLVGSSQTSPSPPVEQKPVRRSFISDRYSKEFSGAQRITEEPVTPMNSQGGGRYLTSARLDSSIKNDRKTTDVQRDGISQPNGPDQSENISAQTIADHSAELLYASQYARTVDRLLSKQKLDDQAITFLKSFSSSLDFIVDPLFIRLKEPKLGRHVEMSNVRKFILPLNLLEEHWTLAVFNLQYQTIDYFDSMSSQYPVPSEQLLAQAKRLDSLLEPPQDNRRWTINPTCSSQQENNIDCGVFTILHALCILGSRPVPAKFDCGLWRFIVARTLEENITLDRAIRCGLVELSDPANASASSGHHQANQDHHTAEGIQAEVKRRRDYDLLVRQRLDVAERALSCNEALKVEVKFALDLFDSINQSRKDDLEKVESDLKLLKDTMHQVSRLFFQLRTEELSIIKQRVETLQVIRQELSREPDDRAMRALDALDEFRRNIGRIDEENENYVAAARQLLHASPEIHKD